MFELLPAEKTGVTFSNEIVEDESLNILTFEYFYNGAGVGIGDFNQDGLPDMFFSSNMGKSRLYLNNGNFSFTDITDISGINTGGKWAAGVSIVDINQDGLPDIYLCFGGPHNAEKRANALYINNGNNTFTDKAAEYGLADTGHSVQAVFFDYDKDNDLDMYLLTNITDETGPNIIRPKRNNSEMANTDRLYRNNGNNTFTNVSKEAGITKEGYGLGIAVADINEDGWPDIFASNDYLSNDLLYINNRDGTFTDIAGKAFKHTSYSAMGNDIADINNDGRLDIMEVDMLPPDNYRKKLMFGATNHDRYRAEIISGYDPQFMRNTLQLNLGPDENGNPTFSEIGQFAGIDATDWSWAPLFADFDNDGWQDLLVTNGYPRDITNRDFINYRAQELMQANSMESLNKKRLAALQKLDGAFLHSFVFQNKNNLAFQDVSSAWGLKESRYSSGAAYADLDNDGDLDIVLVNTGAPASVYKNNSELFNKNHFLTVSLPGFPGNNAGYGTKIKLYAGGHLSYQQFYPVRGYQSTVGSPVHFGLGANTKADSIIVTWPDGKISRLNDIKADQHLKIQYPQSEIPVTGIHLATGKFFKNVSDKLNIHFQHKESPYTDFNFQPLMPHKFSQSGPGIAVGDVNGDGLEDFFIGGAYKQWGQLFIQHANGSFTGKDIDTGKKLQEDMGVLFFDADNDNDLDLYITVGGNEFAAGSNYYQDRLYRNDGRGKFTYDSVALPIETASGSCVVAADYDQDGDLDLFVGGKITPQHYPDGGMSFLLENNNGVFTDVTDKKAPGLKNAGIVNAAIWSDVNNDNRPDLVIAGEWMPITVYLNEGGSLKNSTTQLGLANTVGWWNSIQAGDFNQDGKTDFILGNLGLNSRYKTSAANPMSIYVNDFGNAGSTIGIITYKQNDSIFPIHPRDDLMQQLPGLRKKFPLYADYAKATITDLFDASTLSKTKVIRANTFQSATLINNGSAAWKLVPLPTEAQLAPLFGILVNDYDDDGIEDALLTGNFYGTEVISGRYDAFKGLFLKGKGDGNFIVKENEFRVEGDGKGLAEILVNKKPVVLAALNNDSIKAFELPAENKSRIWKAKPGDAYMIITMENGKQIRREFYYGSGYLSSTGRYARIPLNTRSVEVFNGKGEKRVLPRSF